MAQTVQLMKTKGTAMSGFPFPGRGAASSLATPGCFATPKSQIFNPQTPKTSHTQHRPRALPHLCL